MKHVGENITEFLDVISVDEFFKNSDVTSKFNQMREYLGCFYNDDGEIEPINRLEGDNNE